MKATIPAQIAQTNCTIEVEIIDADIPLLLSKSSLQKAETVLDFKNDKVKMFNKNVDFKLSSNGHYAVNILPNDISNFHETEQILILEQCTSEAEKIKKLTKIHRQFGHASPDNIKRLLKNSNSLDQKISTLVDKIYKDCNTCKLYKRPTLKPVVGLSKATTFNHTVAMDLHQLDVNLRYFHIIDEFSRYGNAVIINSKSSFVSANHSLKNWISLFGCPEQIFSDNGGEFVSKHLPDLRENFNVKILTTPAGSPWSNGLCERHNKILTHMLLKINKDTSCSWETALAWALNAKNSLINVSGFSPHQLVFGENMKLPNVMNDQLAAGSPETKTIGDHLLVLHAARKAFIAAE